MLVETWGITRECSLQSDWKTFSSIFIIADTTPRKCGKGSKVQLVHNDERK